MSLPSQHTTVITNSANGSNGLDFINLNDEYILYEDIFLDLQKSYNNVQCYISMVVCSIGILTNILNVATLTRKGMVSPSNIILTGISISNGLKLVTYLSLATNLYVNHEQILTYENAVIQLAGAIIFMTVHSISVNLTVALAIFRYFTVVFRGNGVLRYNNTRAIKAMLISSVVAIVLCLPTYLSSTIESALISNFPETENGSAVADDIAYVVRFRESSEINSILMKCEFWIQALLLKFLPCLLLTVFIILTIKQITNLNKPWKKRGENVTGQNRRSRKRSNRPSKGISKMLVILMLFFLISEAPKAIMYFLSGFDWNFYVLFAPVSDLLDIITLVTCSVNFVLYFCMNRDFRKTLITIINNVLQKLTFRNAADNVSRTRTLPTLTFVPIRETAV